MQEWYDIRPGAAGPDVFLSSNTMPYKNPEDRRANDRKHREENRLRCAEYLAKHPEENKARCAARYAANTQEYIDASTKWRKENPEKYREINRKSFQKNKPKRSAYARNRYQTDIQYKLARRLRSRLWEALKRGYKSGSAVRDLGCSIEEFKNYLESLFQPSMTWDNYGEWHIDHIKPLDSFDLMDREQLKIACHYSNLQPLWAEDNIRKGCNHG